jgi:hypothetical protein
MRVSRNAPCPCDSGLKFKRCCLDDLRTWHASGGGMIKAEVALEDGTSCPATEYCGDDDVPVAFQLNPLTRAWMENHPAPDDDLGRDEHSRLLVQHVTRLFGESPDGPIAAQLHAMLLERRGPASPPN